MKQLEQILEDLHRQLLSAQILTESLADLLIAKNVLTKEEVEGFCAGKVEAVKKELEKRRAEEMIEILKSIPEKKVTKRKSKKVEDDEEPKLTSMFMGTQIGEA